MSKIIREEDLVEALYQAIRTNLENPFLDSTHLAIDSMTLAKAMAKNIPSVEPEIINIEEVANQIGCATIQSGLYWFEFLKTLDLLGFAIIRKEIK